MTKQSILEDKVSNRFNTNEAAHYLGLSPKSLAVFRCTKRHNIPFVRVCGRIFYEKEALDCWLQSRRVNG